MKRWLFVALVVLSSCGATDAAEDPCFIPRPSIFGWKAYEARLEELARRYPPGSMVDSAGNDLRRPAAIWLQCYCHTRGC